MGFKNLFKVRQPGHGDAVQKQLKPKGTVAITDKGKSVPNGGQKSNV